LTINASIRIWRECSFCVCCRHQWKCSDRRERRSGEQLQHLELRRRRWFVRKVNVGRPYAASWQGRRLTEL